VPVLKGENLVHLLQHNEFASLKTGQELIVKKGCPTIDGPLAEDVTVVVAAVDGFSFLTTEGDGFGACHSKGFVFKTGNTREVVLSEKARQILEELDN